MKRTNLAVIATLIAMVFLAGTGGVGLTAASSPQQTSTLQINVWLSEAGGADPVRLLAPDTTEANVVVQSDLGDRDPKEFRASVVDSSGIQVFGSGTLILPTGPYTETMTVSGKDFFQSYISHTDSQKGELEPAIDRAITAAEGERTQDPCAVDIGDRMQVGRVIDRINQALGVRESVDGPIAQLLRFDALEAAAETDFNTARTELTTVATRGDDAIGELQVPDDAPICSGEGAPEVPDWSPDWDAVLADLNAMKTASNSAASEIESAVGAVDLDADRSFPPTGVAEQCNQHTVQLRVADSDAPSDDYWFAVGTPGDPARLSNPEDPTLQGSLQSQHEQIYSTEVGVSGVPNSTQVYALVLDDVCLPIPDASVGFAVSDESVLSLASTEATTDANGVAEVTVNATDSIGTGRATVIATAGESLTATKDLTIIGPASRIQLLLGGTDPENPPNFGVGSNVQVTAEVKDAAQNDVADGTPVQFSIQDPDHIFADSGEPTTQVNTVDGQATATLVLGSANRGTYTVRAESGLAIDIQQINVVGEPAAIQVVADPPVVPTHASSRDERSSQLTIAVQDSDGNPAPDGTLIELELTDPDDIGVISFQGATRVSSTLYEASLRAGEASVRLFDEEQPWYREIELSVTAVYSVGGTPHTVSTEITVLLRGESTFLPLIMSNVGGQ